jgi:hypothetical protein
MFPNAYIYDSSTGFGMEVLTGQICQKSNVVKYWFSFLKKKLKKSESNHQICHTPIYIFLHVSKTPETQSAAHLLK